jgi:sugar phosphate isomerase/epimerase
MTKQTATAKISVNVSIGDFSPLLRGPEFLFRGIATTGAHGVELWVGIKSRWTINYYRRLSQKYNVPIVALHQPLWAMTGVYFDEGFFRLGQSLGVQHITCHPLPGVALSSNRMHAYFSRLASMQEKFGIPILIENLPQQYRNGILHHFFPPASDSNDVLLLSETVSKYGLNLTLDTDHINLAWPHEEPWFDAVLPHVKHMHLSSFGAKKRHMPLYLGDFGTNTYLSYLKKNRYCGTITLEIAWPRSITMLAYDFEATRKSVSLVQQNH